MPQPWKVVKALAESKLIEEMKFRKETCDARRIAREAEERERLKENHDANKNDRGTSSVSTASINGSGHSNRPRAVNIADNYHLYRFLMYHRQQ